jgi:hypothetical protein
VEAQRATEEQETQEMLEAPAGKEMLDNQETQDPLVMVDLREMLVVVDRVVLSKTKDVGVEIPHDAVVAEMELLELIPEMPVEALDQDMHLEDTVDLLVMVVLVPAAVVEPVKREDLEVLETTEHLAILAILELLEVLEAQIQEMLDNPQVLLPHQL